MTTIEEIDQWLSPRSHHTGETPMNDDTAELIPVAGIGDWFKGKIKNVLIAYAKPFWDDIKAAIQNRDFAKLADVIDKIGALAGYAELAKAVSDVFRELAAGNYLTALEKAIAAVKLIVALFPKVEADAGPIRLMAADASFEAEVDALLDMAFPPAKVAATGDEPPKTEFGILEISAIIGAIIQIARFIIDRRKDKAVAA